MKVKALGLFSALIALPTAALAQGTAAQRAACTPDVFRLCSSSIPDVPAIIACLQREKAHLSNDCRTVMASTATAAATRSLKPRVELCRFDRQLNSIDEVWHTWCKELSWTD
jgi:hypothetical protein